MAAHLRTSSFITLAESLGPDPGRNATFSDGLLKYDRQHQSFIRYRNDPADDQSLTENRITTLLQDRERNIWVAFGATEPAGR
jgi:hypothetical protein